LCVVWVGWVGGGVRVPRGVLVGSWGGVGDWLRQGGGGGGGAGCGGSKEGMGRLRPCVM